VTYDTELAERVAIVRGRIARAAARANRSTDDITLVAVSKTMPADRVISAAGIGVTDFGENRVQEAETKIPVVAAALGARVASTIRWHLIGHLQSNKARSALRLFSTVESVDSVNLAATIDRLARERGAPVDILLEVNVGEEPTKFGFSAEQISKAFREVRSFELLNVRGLMTVAPPVADPEDARKYFRQLRSVRDRLESENPGARLAELSMGMTGDYEVAIEEGATIVRIGRALFGERPDPG
jgi:hypothetical protein